MAEFLQELNNFGRGVFDIGRIFGIGYGKHWSQSIILKNIQGLDSMSTEERINESYPQRTGVDDINKKPLSRRDMLGIYGDTSTDYFIHNHQIDRQVTTGWENQDPVMFGVEIVIDALSSPLLNGSIYDFFALYPDVSEIQSRRLVYHDFKKQFQKIFKTKGKINFESYDDYSGFPLMSSTKGDINDLGNYAEAERPFRMLTRGKKAYLSHYLYKVDGLHNLIESILPGQDMKYLVDYQKDLISLTFNEDVSGTMASLAHMYKLLHWSRPNGKGIVPENLLRFNCDIIVSECRNFRRVRQAANSGNFEVVKDNVSRHIYSLKECQFYFNQPAHDDTIDLSATKTYDGFTVQMTYKYSTTRYEKWVPDPKKFGQYVGYNNGALWKIGNKGGQGLNETLGTKNFNNSKIDDYSVPKFYTSGGNTLNQPGVNSIFVLETGTFGDKNTNGKGDGLGDDESGNVKETKNEPSALGRLATNAKKGSLRILSRAGGAVMAEVNSQINTRTALLKSTLGRVRNVLGGAMGNVYPLPYVFPKREGIYFDIRNELMNYLGEEITTAWAKIKKLDNPWQDPNSPKMSGLAMLKAKYSTEPSIFSKTGAGNKTLNEILGKGNNANIPTNKKTLAQILAESSSLP